MQQLPFVTDRSELALILEMLGEQRLTIQRHFSAALLAKLGCSNVKEALARGHAGKVVYFFASSAQCLKIQEAYFDQIKRNEAREPSEKPNATNAELARFAVSVLMMRKAYVDLWKSGSVHVTEGGGATDVPTEVHVVTQEDIDLAGGKLIVMGIERKVGDKVALSGAVNFAPLKSVTINLSKELRAEVGL